MEALLYIKIIAKADKMKVYKRYYIVFIGICLLIMHNSLCYAQTATEKMTEALKARGKGNIQSAIKLLKYACKLAIDDKQKNMASFMLGDCYIESENYSEAIKVYENALQSNLTKDEKSEAYFNIMKAASAIENSDKVEKYYKKMFSEIPNSSFADIAKSYYGNLYGDTVAATIATEAKKSVKSSSSKKSDNKTSEPKTSNKKTETKVAAANSKNKKDDKVKNPFKDTKKENKSEKKENKSEKKESVSKSNSSKTVSKNNVALLKEILAPKVLSDSKREELVSSILILQDKLKDNVNKNGADSLLYELAQNTADFGEYVEACKNYDKLLNNYPSSPYVEKAYYEAIRLRAMLGVHEAVISWGNAFLNTFTSSSYRDKVKALIEYSKAGGKIQLENGKTVSDNVNTSNVVNVSKTKNELLKDIRYKTASQYMKDGNYDAALQGFNSLKNEYYGVSQLWWDTALVNVQMEDFKSASIAINKMLNLEPDNEDANSLSGYINYRLENYEEAANAYENVGESEGHGVNFFDAKSASKKMRNSAKNN